MSIPVPVPRRSAYLAHSAKDLIVELMGIVKQGDEGAAAELHSAVSFATQMLTWICETHPRRFIEIAARRFDWPIVLCLQPEEIERKKTFLRSLKLGTETDVNIDSGKTFSRKVPANLVVLHLHRLAKELQKVPISSWTPRQKSRLVMCGIPYPHRRLFADEAYQQKLARLEAWGRSGSGSLLNPLRKSTRAEWSAAGGELFEIVYDSEFQDHPELVVFREHVRLRAGHADGSRGTRGLVRKAMRQALKQAWGSIASLD